MLGLSWTLNKSPQHLHPLERKIGFTQMSPFKKREGRVPRKVNLHLKL